MRRLSGAQIEAGVDGIVPVGTTGESPTLDYEEHIEVIARSVEFAAGKIKVMAGTGGNSTSEAVYLTDEAEKAGADSTLQVAPYYNRPTQEGLYQHFLEISRASKLPVILYNVPSRCGVEIAVETVRRLAAATPRVVGIKEAGGNPDRVSQLRAALGSRFSIFSGDDSLTLPFMALGAHGVISVASNIIPRQVAQMVRACAARGFRRRAANCTTAIIRFSRICSSRPTPSRSRPPLAMLGSNRGRIPPAAGAVEREKPRDSESNPRAMRHSQTMTRIIIAGAKGRMGQALLRGAEDIPRAGRRRPD